MRQETLDRLTQLFEDWTTKKVVAARIDENQRRLDKIEEYRNRKPVPGELTTASFGSASGAMEVAGFEQSFKDRIAELIEESKE